MSGPPSRGWLASEVGERGSSSTNRFVYCPCSFPHFHLGIKLDRRPDVLVAEKAAYDFVVSRVLSKINEPDQVPKTDGP
jgi:hypothetical protein